MWLQDDPLIAPGPTDKMISYPKLYFNFPKELWTTSSLGFSDEHIFSDTPLSHSVSLFPQFPIFSFETLYPIFKNHLLSLHTKEVHPSLPIWVLQTWNLQLGV